MSGDHVCPLGRLDASDKRASDMLDPGETLLGRRW
jgi:hypothetical protein